MVLFCRPMASDAGFVWSGFRGRRRFGARVDHQRARRLPRQRNEIPQGNGETENVENSGPPIA